MRLIEISETEAVVQSPSRLLPGAWTELQVLQPQRRMVSGLIAVCRVTRLEPLCYEGRIVFDAARPHAGSPDLVAGGGETR